MESAPRLFMLSGGPGKRQRFSSFEYKMCFLGITSLRSSTIQEASSPSTSAHRTCNQERHRVRNSLRPRFEENYAELFPGSVTLGSLWSARPRRWLRLLHSFTSHQVPWPLPPYQTRRGRSRPCCSASHLLPPERKAVPTTTCFEAGERGQISRFLSWVLFCLSLLAIGVDTATPGHQTINRLP